MVYTSIEVLVMSDEFKHNTKAYTERMWLQRRQDRINSALSRSGTSFSIFGGGTAARYSRYSGTRSSGSGTGFKITGFGVLATCLGIGYILLWGDLQQYFHVTTEAGQFALGLGLLASAFAAFGILYLLWLARVVIMVCVGIAALCYGGYLAFMHFVLHRI
jgi:hypothetical protein